MEKIEPILTTGKRFGKLVLVEKDPHLITKSTHGKLIACECDCGSETKIRAYNLVSGLRTCCGCSDFLFDKVTVSVAINCEEVGKSSGVSSGLAYALLKQGLSPEDIGKLVQAQIRALRDQKYGDQYQIGSVIGRAVIIGMSTLRGTFCGSPATYDTVRCLCGREMYVRQDSLQHGRLPKCACDEMTKKLSQLLKYDRSAQTTADFVYPLEKSAKALTLAPTRRNPVCQKGPHGEGLCRNYTGNNGCLSYWAFGKKTPIYKEGFSCYRRPVQSDTTCQTNFGNTRLVDTGSVR